MHMYMYEGKTIQAHFYVKPSLKLINSTNKNPCRITNGLNLHAIP